MYDFLFSRCVTFCLETVAMRFGSSLVSISRSTTVSPSTSSVSSAKRTKITDLVLLLRRASFCNNNILTDTLQCDTCRNKLASCTVYCTAIAWHAAIFSGKALPFIHRGIYKHLSGRRKGEVYSLLDILVVRLLPFHSLVFIFKTISD